MRKTFVLLPLAAAMMLAGCSLAPTFERPEAPVAQSWPQDEATKNAKVLTEGLQTWAEFFADNRLHKVIEMALANNRNLRATVEKVQAARMAYGASVSGLFPSVNAAAKREFSGTANPHTGTNRGNYTAAAAASFELDLFGRIYNQTEQNYELYVQSELAQRTAQMTLIAEVAQTWVGLGAAKELLKLANGTLESQQKSFELIKTSYNLGASSLIDVQQAQTTVANARIAQATAMRQVAQYRNALTLLAGQSVDSALEPEGIVSGITKPIAGLSNVPSEVLLKRPDIAAAESRLRSANASIGAARAAFFPSLSITGSIGIASPTLHGLFDHQTAAWSYTPSVNLPIFSAGSQIMNLRAANANQRAAVASYEATIQTAFREVADALATEGTVEEQLKSTKELADVTHQSYELATERYKSGVDSYLQVLVSQRSDFSAQQALINAQVSRVSSLITLYKVMGGGSQLPKDE